jgi:hypothetical protein
MGRLGSWEERGQQSRINRPTRISFLITGNEWVMNKPTKLLDLELQGKEVSDMLWTIVAILLILWLLGFSLHVGGGLIHTLLVIAVIVFIFNLISGRRSSG